MYTTRNIVDQYGGTMKGRDWALTSCPVCQSSGREDQRALSVRDGANGNLLLTCHKSNCSFLDIVKAWNLPRPTEKPKPDPDAIKAAEADAAKRRDNARDIWKQTHKIAGTPSSVYLRSRGLRVQPHNHIIRHHSLCPHPSNTRLPAMVARIQGPDDSGLGIHRTFLTPDGAKTDRDPQKATLGTFMGGAVRLGNRRPTHLAIGEGIETCLAFWQLYKVDAWSCLSTAGIVNFDPPPFVEAIALLMDDDVSGAGAEACEKAAFGLRRRGYLVRVKKPDPGFADFCDQLNGIKRDDRKAGP